MALEHCRLDRVSTVKHQLQYLLSVPKDYGKDEGKKWPLVLFLHGAGERGEELEAVKRNGIPKRLANGEDFPFITVAPQCPETSYWPLESERLGALLDEITELYDVDENKIYLTGLSMGGMGTWQTACRYPDRFAAIAPVCGSGNPHMAVRLIKHLPVWVFHGAKDDIVPVQKSEEMVEALSRNGADVKFTIYPEANHDAWTETYNNPELYEWLLSHSRTKKERGGGEW